MNEYVLDHVSHVGGNNGEKLVPGEAKKTSMTVTILSIEVAEDYITLRYLTLHLRSPLQGGASPPFTEEDTETVTGHS